MFKVKSSIIKLLLFTPISQNPSGSQGKVCLIQNSALLRVRESGHRADVNVESVVSQCNGSRLYMGKIVMSQFSVLRV